MLLVTGKSVVNLISRLNSFGPYEQVIIFYVVDKNLSVKECRKATFSLNCF